MEYRTLGSSGTSVSSLTLGTMTFGSETDREGAFEQLDVFLEAGGTLVDTADVYSGGVSEEIVGAWLAERPAEVTERVVLATKGRFPTSGEPNGVGLSRRHLTRALDASLRRLGVEAVDLYQVHAWDPWTPVEETLSTLDAFVRAGKVHNVGLSNFTGWQLQKAVDVAAAEGLAPPVTLQPQYNLLVREIEWEIVPAAEENGLGLLPWSPLGGGWLSGKYTRDTAPTGATRLGENPERGVEAYARRNAQQRTWAVLDAVQTIAERRGTTMAQVSLAWLLAQPAVSSVILGARTTEQLRDNLGSADLELEAAELATLDEASDPEPADYPYGGPGAQQRSRKLTGGR
ncbi:aldo/keto reductase [Kineococcus sp. T13]|uniref:aldo/keto reductase n=1 Tax=Kineococcus vitellinus TaxID=2696565 RepID=UPI0014132B92|nr:aldo/keto reductase [Kineococcus vitellinus]NAZ77131.1 aldo/keto reductase [Kineococcus vitellinus]